ncbi:RluA family pseudouridine synthase [Spirochaeta isovalerica]|uniref:Pseudouridine synthase n=1 Tax=Spirochaeta isovalerica TaxID=150 RepID=A0A841R540_9SPIO|nr:23S rRNA pseudouridine1911/1915/1917 synthase [Spirochaeta isovalerica]
MKQRIDKYVSDREILTRSQIKSRNAQVFINGVEVKLSRKVGNGDTFELHWDDPEALDIEPEEMDLQILYEDENAIVVNKEQGIVVHPANGNYTGTLVQGLLFHIKNLGEKFDNQLERPGIVHRLDKDTSGVIIAAKNPETHEFLSQQFRDKTNEKHYLALVRGYPPKRRGLIETHLTRHPVERKKYITHESQGKFASTEYRVLRSWDKYALMLLKLNTGRTHQLRVHMVHIGCPILGDPIYGRKDNLYPDATLMLHAWKLKIKLPGNMDYSLFKAPVPVRFRKIIGKISRQLK